MKKRPHEHLYPLMDTLIDKAAETSACEGCEVSCKKGCAHCCHLLVEASWEEAMELAHWVNQQPTERREQFLQKISNNAATARSLFNQSEEGKRFSQPTDDGDAEIPDEIFDDYFYDSVKPCPFLENDMCSAYEHRPSACRLHMVNTPVELCMRECSAENADKDVEVPESMETLKTDLEPVLVGLIEDGRWGQLAIMVEAALQNLQTINATKMTEAQI